MFTLGPDYDQLITQLKCLWHEIRLFSLFQSLSFLRQHSFNSHFLKCLWSEIFYYLIRKSFQSDLEWHLFYCDSTLGCWVIQDFDLTRWTQSRVRSQKIEYLSQRFLFRSKNWNLVQLFTCYKFPWYVISVATQWAPGPLHSKGKIRVFLLQEVLFDLVVPFSGCERIWTSTRKSVILWSNK